MTLVECTVVANGVRVWLPFEQAQRLAALGAVRLPTPKPDLRYAAPSRQPLSATWRGGAFVPGVPVRY